MRSIVFVPLFSLVAFSALSQVNSFEVGLSGGLNMTSLHGKNYEHYFDWVYSPTVSLNVRYSFSDAWSVGTGIAYESKGAKGIDMKVLDEEGISLGSHYNFKYVYQYITVPLLIRYTVPYSLPFYITAGPYMGYMVNYTESFEIGKLNRTPDMQKTDWGLSAGIGISFPITEHWNVSAELRNNMGLYNVRTGNNTYSTAPAHPIIELNPVYTNSTNMILGINRKF